MASKFSELHDFEAEEGLLSAIFRKNDLLSELKVKASDFARPSNALMYTYMWELYRSGSTVDIITLVSALRDNQKLEDAGGIAGVTAILNREPTAAGAMKYQEIILDFSQRRQLHHAAVEIASEAIDGGKPIDMMVNEAMAKLNGIGRGEDDADTTFIDSAKLMIVTTDRIYDGFQTGIRTGFRDLDEKLAYGLRAGELIVLAGRPSMGKTALCLNLITNAVRQQKKVLFFSLETGVESIGTRLTQSLASITQQEIINIDRCPEANDRMLKAADWWAKRKDYLMLNTAGYHTVDSIKALCRRAKLKNGLDMVVIDHAQLISAVGFKNDRVREMSYISRMLKQMAKELEVPVVLLSQLNRGVESREDKRPRMSDLRESGSIEQDADVVMLIYRDAYYHPEGNSCKVEINVAKQKDGATGVVPLAYVKEFMRFGNVPIQEALGKDVKDADVPA